MRKGADPKARRIAAKRCKHSLGFSPPQASKAVLKVGDGCGFVVQGSSDRFVVTAAHCLPYFPPCASISFFEERTYQALLGKIGEECTVSAECLFADPIGDIAILGSPDDQALDDQAQHYEKLVDSLVPMSIADAESQGQAWLRSLGGEWFKCIVHHTNGPLWISDAKEGIAPGMSGSPILAGDGSAIGIVCASSTDDNDVPTKGGPNPRLVHHLPGWLLRALGHDFGRGVAL